MTPRDLAASFLARALEESRASVSELRAKGINLRTVYEVIEGRNVKHSCRFDTLVSLLDACGFELEMKRKVEIPEEEDNRLPDEGGPWYPPRKS